MLAEKLTIIVVTCNSMKVLPSFFQHLQRALGGEECPILVCDNGSRDGVENFVMQRSPVLFLGSDTNEGYGAALNRGILACSTPFVALMNPDVAIQTGGFRELVGFLEEVPLAAGVSGVVAHLRSYPASFDLDDVFPGRKVGVHRGYETVKTRLLFYSGLQTKYAHWSWAVPWSTVPAADAVSVSRLNGCFGLYRRAALIRAGLFDPRFFLYFEEDDLARRLIENGHRLYVTSRCVVVHLSGSGSAMSGSPWTDKLLLNSQYLYFRKHYGLLYAWVSFVLIWAVISVVMLYQTLLRRAGRSRSRCLWKWHLGSLLCGGGMPPGTLAGSGQKNVNYNWSTRHLPEGGP